MRAQYAPPTIHEYALLPIIALRDVPTSPDGSEEKSLRLTSAAAAPMAIVGESIQTVRTPGLHRAWLVLMETARPFATVSGWLRTAGISRSTAWREWTKLRLPTSIRLTTVLHANAVRRIAQLRAHGQGLDEALMDLHVTQARLRTAEREIIGLGDVIEDFLPNYDLPNESD